MRFRQRSWGGTFGVAPKITVVLAFCGHKRADLFSSLRIFSLASHPGKGDAEYLCDPRRRDRDNRRCLRLGRVVGRWLVKWLALDGWYPQGGVVKDAAENFYGALSSGGAYHGGAIFKLTP